MEEGDLNPRRCEEVLDDENRGKLLLDMRRVIRHPIQFLRVTDPFITAHHPSCSHFDEHTFSIRGRKWCIGCTFNSISFFGAMSIIFLIWLFDPNLLSRVYLFWGGIVLSVIYFLSSFSGVTENRKKAKIISKFLLGSGFAGICWSILLIDTQFSTDLPIKLAIIVILYLGFITVLNIKRNFEILRECEACEFKMRWSKCPGFRETACKMMDAEFLYTEQVQAESD
ncbi:MAG: hypothetical protein RTV72_01090 [Candidatus Thorarchaeota archaeon]